MDASFIREMRPLRGELYKINNQIKTGTENFSKSLEWRDHLKMLQNYFRERGKELGLLKRIIEIGKLNLIVGEKVSLKKIIKEIERIIEVKSHPLIWAQQMRDVSPIRKKNAYTQMNTDIQFIEKDGVVQLKELLKEKKKREIAYLCFEYPGCPFYFLDTNIGMAIKRSGNQIEREITEGIIVKNASLIKEQKRTFDFILAEKSEGTLEKAFRFALKNRKTSIVIKVPDEEEGKDSREQAKKYARAISNSEFYRKFQEVFILVPSVNQLVFSESFWSVYREEEKKRIEEIIQSRTVPTEDVATQTLTYKNKIHRKISAIDIPRTQWFDLIPKVYSEGEESPSKQSVETSPLKNDEDKENGFVLIDI